MNIEGAVKGSFSKLGLRSIWFRAIHIVIQHPHSARYQEQKHIGTVTIHAACCTEYVYATDHNAEDVHQCSYSKQQSWCECTSISVQITSTGSFLMQNWVLKSRGHHQWLCTKWRHTHSTAVFLNRQAAARYRALASTIPGRERP